MYWGIAINDGRKINGLVLEFGAATVTEMNIQMAAVKQGGTAQDLMRQPPKRQVILTWGTDKKLAVKMYSIFLLAVTKLLMRNDWRKAGFLSAPSSSRWKRCGCGSVKQLLRVQLWAGRNQRWTLPFSHSAHSLPPFPPVNLVWNHSPRNDHSWWPFPLMNSFWKLHHKYTQGRVS